MRRFLRIAFRVVAFGIVLLMILLAGAYAFTFTDRFRDLARTELVAYLKGAFRGEIGLAAIEGSIWGDLTLRDLSIHYSGKEIARLPRVVVRYALLPVLESKVQVTGIEVPDAVLDLEQDGEGRWNLLEALASRAPAPPPETSSSFEIALERVTLDNATIRLTPQGSPTYFLSEGKVDVAVNVLGKGTNADLRTLAVRVAREGYPAERAEAALAYEGAASPPRATIRRFVVASDASKASLVADVENLASKEDMQIRADLTIDALAPTDVKLFAPRWSSPDALSGRVKVDGKMSDLHAEAALAAGEAKIVAKASADAAAADPRYEAALTLEKVDVAKLAAELGVAGVVDGKLHARGVGKELAGATGEADLVVRGLASSGWQLGDVAATAAVADRRAKVDAGVTIDKAERLKLTADADLGGSESYRVAVSTSHFNPKRLSAEKAPLAGDVNLKALAEGKGFTAAKTEGRAQVDVAPTKLGDVAVERGRLDVHLGGGRAKIAEATVTAKDATLRAKGDVGLSPEERGRLEYDLGVKDVRPWLALAGQEGTGAVTLHGTASGKMGDLAADGRVQAAGLRVGTSSVGRADLTYEVRGIGQPEPRARLVANAQDIAAGIALRETKAELSLQEKGRFAADVSATDSESRAHHIAAQGRFASPNVDLKLVDLTLGSPDGPWRLATPASIALRQKQVSISGFQLGNGNRRVRVEGMAAATGRQALRVDIEGFTLETLQALLAGAPEMRGAVTASVALGGTAAAPLLDAHTTISGLSIARQPYNGLTASAHYEAGALRARADFRQDSSHQLTATADAPMVARWDPSWSMSSTGEANLTLRSSGLSLAVLNAFAGRSVQKIGGELAADVTATGPLERLRPNGTIELRDGAFTVPEFGTSISEGTIVVRFDPERARVEKLFARGVDGTIEGRGVVPFATASSEPMDLTIEAKQFRAASSHRYRADVEGKIAVGGTTTAPKVNGRVEVLDAALRPDIAFLGKAPKPRDETIKIVTPGAPQPPNPATAAPPPVPKPDAYQNSTIDVVLVIHRNTWIRHEEAAIDLEGEVRATKPPGGDLELIGEVHTVHGWAVLQGRRFTLSRGSIAFTGGKEIDPTLDVVADYKKGEYLVHAIVSGTANAPALTLESEPQLEQADIVSVLLFGKPSKDLNDGQKSDVKAKATEMAGAYAFTEVGQSVSRALGLESKGVQVEELSTERLALGTYLTDKTYVTLGQNIGDRQGQEVAIQYEFVPHWSVETSTSTVGGSGMDLIWHRSY